MMSSLVWLFQDYRDAVDEIHRLHGENAALRFQLENQGTGEHMRLLREFQEQALSDQPFPDGKIPDNYWLSPIDESMRGERG